MARPGTPRKLMIFCPIVLGLGIFLVSLAFAQNPNERLVKPGPNPQDRDDINKKDGKIWVLDFKFKDPRLIKVDIPGRGQKVCWYLWYQVINNTGDPRRFIPEFEIRTLDTNQVHKDQILPKVQKAIIRLEDPTADPEDSESGFYKIKNSVTITRDEIPVSKEGLPPKKITGVAIWDDVDPDSNRFSLFVTGLSNGWTVTDPIPPDVEPVVRRKTLQLNFRRVGDKFMQKTGEIQFVPPSQWIYRASSIKIPELGAEKKATPSN
ncbi:MAG: hypothetical protein EXR99_12785 [Gemmataceae bacterium]|nr:hypothetical protein [Gemmataceae bacterium]